MMFWILEGREEADAEKVRGQIDMPPVGYTGSLKGTAWDPDEMVKAYQQGGVH